MIRPATLGFLTLWATPLTAQDPALVQEVHAIWSAGAQIADGIALPEPVENRGAAAFECMDCEPAYMVFIVADTLMEGYGTTDMETVIAEKSDCSDVDCTVTRTEFQGLPALRISFDMLATANVTTTYFLPDGRDLLITVIAPNDDPSLDLSSFLDALESAFIPALLETRL